MGAANRLETLRQFHLNIRDKLNNLLDEALTEQSSNCLVVS